jgi:hypothetical protein
MARGKLQGGDHDHAAGHEAPPALDASEPFRLEGVVAGVVDGLGHLDIGLSGGLARVVGHHCDDLPALGGEPVGGAQNARPLGCRA